MATKTPGKGGNSSSDRYFRAKGPFDGWSLNDLLDERNRLRRTTQKTDQIDAELRKRYP